MRIPRIIRFSDGQRRAPAFKRLRSLPITVMSRLSFHVFYEEECAMLNLTELMRSSVECIGQSMGRWMRGNLRDEEPELTRALQVVIDLSGGLRWVERCPGILEPTVAPMRAGEFRSFDWDRYHAEMLVPYHGVSLFLSPRQGKELVENLCVSQA